MAFVVGDADALADGLAQPESTDHPWKPLCRGRRKSGREFSKWRIASARATEIEVYASSRARDALLEARFYPVELRPNAPLRLDDALDKLWRLRAPTGKTVETVRPRVNAGDLDGRPTRCTGA